MCCKNSRHREPKGKIAPSDEASYKEQNRENFARLDKKRKEREKAEKRRQSIKEAKLRREERAAWIASLNPFGRQQRAAYRGGEVLLEAVQEDETPKEPNPFSPEPARAQPPLVGKAAARQPKSKRDERPFKERMAEAKKKSNEIRAAVSPTPTPPNPLTLRFPQGILPPLPPLPTPPPPPPSPHTAPHLPPCTCPPALPRLWLCTVAD